MPPSRSFDGDALSGKLFERSCRFAQSAATQMAEHSRVLAELDVSVVDDLHPVAPGISELHSATGEQHYTRLLQLAFDLFFVVDHETEMTLAVGGLRFRFEHRNKLIAH